ncbi:hypothetical protein FSP39_006626 [Pinctada imbricata]|uniref:Uncharacterized protein n=1 Tax=Pinctada imbricata TaxID=66713 RepID=A0AA88XVN0_PINIB|nr:hypothetical protein FSP39_006626 [Pinctada imbricata]
MEQPVDSPGLDNDSFLNALREEDFLNNLCQKSFTDNGKFSRDLSSDTSSDAVIPQTKNFCAKVPQEKCESIIDIQSRHSSSRQPSVEMDSKSDQKVPYISKDLLTANKRGSQSVKTERRTSSTKGSESQGSVNDIDSDGSLTSQRTDALSDSIGKRSLSSDTKSDVKKKRYNKTHDALQGSGLLGITMKTADLIKQNRKLQHQLDELKKQAALLLEDVLRNPENKQYKEALQTGNKTNEDAKYNSIKQ